MKKNVSFFILALLFQQGVFAQIAINFVEANIQEAIDMAKKQNKYVFLYTYTKTCIPCKQMEDSVFKDYSVATLYNDIFINIKIDINTITDKMLMVKYQLNNSPSYTYISTEGGLLLKNSKYTDKNIFLSNTKALLNTLSVMEEAEAKYLVGNRDIATLYQYILHLNSLHKDYDIPLSEYLELQTNMNTPENLELIYKLNKNNMQNSYFNNKNTYSSLIFQLYRKYYTELEKVYPALDLYLITHNALYNNIANAEDANDIKNLIFFTDLEIQYSTGSYKKNAIRRNKRILYNAYLKQNNWEKVLEMSFDRYKNFTIPSDSMVEVFSKKGKEVGYPDTFLGVDMSLSKPELEDYEDVTKTCYMFYKNTSNLEHLACATKWIETILALGNDFENLKVYALLLNKQGKKKEAKEVAKKAFQMKNNDTELNRVFKKR